MVHRGEEGGGTGSKSGSADGSNSRGVREALEDLVELALLASDATQGVVALVSEGGVSIEAATRGMETLSLQQENLLRSASEQDGLLFVPDSGAAAGVEWAGEREAGFFLGARAAQSRDPEDKVVLAVWGRGGSSVAPSAEEAFRKLARQADDQLERRRLEQAIAACERRAETLSRQFADAERIASFGRWERNVDSDQLWCSKQLYEILGRTEEAGPMAAEELIELVHPEDRAGFQDARERASRARERFHHEYRILRAGGEVRHVVSSGEALPASEVQGSRYYGVMLDVTDRKQVEEALLREERRYRSFFDNSPELILIHRGDRIEHVNTGAVSILGARTPEDIVGRSIWDFIHPKEVARVQEKLKTALAEPITVSLEIEVITLDGTHRVLETRSASFVTDDGMAIQVVCRDATERKAMEARLVETERMLQVAGRLAAVGGWQVRLDPMEITWSDEVAAIHEEDPGFSPDLESGFRYYAPEDQELVRKAFTRCVERGESFDLEVTLVTARGRRLEVRAIGRAVCDETGAVVAVEGAFQEITERKRAELELRRRDEELQEAVNRLSRTLESITDAFFTVDKSWSFEYVNREAERLLGQSREELIGENLWDVFKEAIGTEFEWHYRQACEGNHSVSFESFYPPLDRWFEVSAYPSDGGLSVYFRDVSERHESQERMRFLEICVERMNDIVLVTKAAPLEEPGPEITFVNEAFVRLTGYSRAEVLGRSPRMLQGPLTDRAELDRLREALESGEPVRSEIVNYTKSGEPYWLEMDIVPLTNEDSALTHFLAVERDVSERRRDQEALKEREEALNSLMSNLPSIVYLCDESGAMLRWNREVERVLGYSDEEVAKSDIMDTVAPVDRERAQAGREETLRTGRAEEILRLISKNGEERPFLVRKSRVVVDGRPCVLGVAVDVSVQRKAEARIRRQATLLDQTRDAIFVIDAHGKVGYWNRAAERLYGWTAMEAIALPSVHPLFVDPKALERILTEVKISGEWTGDLEQRSRDGELLCAEGRWTLLQSEDDGEYNGVLAVNTDVSEKRQLEAQFLRVQRLEAIGTLAGGIAHDLNNILAPILLSIEVLRTRAVDKRDLRTLQTIESATRRGADIIKQVLTFARGLGGERVAVQPRHVLNEIMSLVAETFPKTIETRLELPRDLGRIFGDPTQLHQALLNLCVNARDAMPSGGSLTLSAENIQVASDELALGEGSGPGQYVCFSVRDTGTGMAPEIVKKIFDPFFTTKGEGKGTGLGLATVAGIVESNGGFMRVTTQLGKGSRFQLCFPTHSESDGAASFESGSASLPSGNGEVVLLVDDEAPVRLIAEETLQAFGYRPLLAENGAAALAAFAKSGGRVDLVITDLTMPVMDGAALIRALRKRDPKLPIIASSGFTADSALSAEIAEMGVPKLAKPYTAEALLAMIRRMLESVG